MIVTAIVVPDAMLGGLARMFVVFVMSSARPRSSCISSSNHV
jgi:hypothetical protein